MMINKDKRSLILLLALGDGCLHYIKRQNKVYGGITIDHGIMQADYQSWKAKLLSYVANRNVSVRTGHKGNSVQVSLSLKRIRAWKRFCYFNDKKSIPRILKFVQHPELAMAVMLMDDGYVETNGDRKGAKFRLFLCDQTQEELNFIINWFKEHFNVTPVIKYQNDSKKQKSYPYLKFNSEDSLTLWGIIKDFALSFKSMRHKFRNMDQHYKTQLNYLQRTTSQHRLDDIVRTIEKT